MKGVSRYIALVLIVGNWKKGSKSNPAVSMRAELDVFGEEGKGVFEYMLEEWRGRGG